MDWEPGLREALCYCTFLNLWPGQAVFCILTQKRSLSPFLQHAMTPKAETATTETTVNGFPHAFHRRGYGVQHGGGKSLDPILKTKFYLCQIFYHI